MPDPLAPNQQPAPGAAGASPATSVIPAPAAPAPTPAPAPAPANQVPGTPKPAAPAGATPTPGVTPGMVPLSALQEERTKRQELQGVVEQLKATVDRLQQPQPVQQQVQQQQPAPYGYTPEQIEKLWEEDPKQAVRAELFMGFNWYDQLNSQLDTQADALQSKYPDFANYRTAAISQIRSLPLNQRDPSRLEQAYFYVRGTQFDTIMRQKEAELMQRFQAPAGFQVPSAGTFGPGAGHPAGGVELTAEQVNVAAAMGLTPEAYAAGLPKARP